MMRSIKEDGWLNNNIRVVRVLYIGINLFIYNIPPAQTDNIIMINK